MAKVCVDWFPMESYKGQRSPGFYMHDTLKENIDALIKNVKKDWDFVILISAGGMVRMGKSLIAQQIAIYWCYQLYELYRIKVPFNIKENIVFHGTELIKHGNRLGTKHKHAPIIFDEAGADLEGVKVMKRTTQAVKDYLRECGQYNMLTILVLPEYFDLPKGIALSRSDFLLDCFVSVDKKDEFERGHFNFYSRPNKKKLYLKGKKELNYRAYSEDFNGVWDEVYPIEIFVEKGEMVSKGTTLDFENSYRKAKAAALKSREGISSKEMRTDAWLKASVKYMYDNDLTYHEIADEINARSKLRLTYRTVARILKGERGYDDEES